MMSSSDNPKACDNPFSSDELLFVPELVVFDFDGVFTDNKVYVFSDGSEAVVCHRGDSIGTNALKERRISAIILSTESNSVVQQRGAKIGITVFSNCQDKAAFLRQYCDKNQIDMSRVVYVGNDTNDLTVMSLTGYPVCPADAHPEIKKISRKVLHHPGGQGAVREICDLICSIADHESEAR